MLVGATRSGVWWWPHALAATLTAVAWIMQVLVGRSLPTWAYIALLVGGSLSALLAYLLPLRHASIERRGRLEAQALATNAVGAYKVQMHDMLMPLSVVVTDIITAHGQKRRDAQHTLRQLVVDLAAENIGPERTRACFFEYNDGPPRTLTRKNWKGRDNQPRTCFEEGTTEGNYVLDIVDKHASVIVVDVDKIPPPGWVTKATYKTFICATVCSENQVLGILTLDSLKPEDLSGDDLTLMRLLAQLLAIGLSA